MEKSVTQQPPLNRQCDVIFVEQHRRNLMIWTENVLTSKAPTNLDCQFCMLEYGVLKVSFNHSYKLPLKKWQKKLNEDEKRLISDRKKKIQDEFKSKMGILVDIPKAEFGNTNNGNTSRRFFNDPETSAAFTGVDVSWIARIKIILEVISSGHKIDVEKFRQYTLDTAKLYVELYPWCPMTPTLHKVLVHGPDIVENALLPIGQLSEEAAEARNKHFREYRLSYIC